MIGIPQGSFYRANLPTPLLAAHRLSSHLRNGHCLSDLNRLFPRGYYPGITVPSVQLNSRCDETTHVSAHGRRSAAGRAFHGAPSYHGPSVRRTGGCAARATGHHLHGRRHISHINHEPPHQTHQSTHGDGGNGEGGRRWVGEKTCRGYTLQRGRRGLAGEWCRSTAVGVGRAVLVRVGGVVC